MTEDQKQFEEKYLFTIVVPKKELAGQPIVQYLVTAALYHWEGDISIIALFPQDGTGILPITFKVSDTELETLLNKLDIVGKLPQEKIDEWANLISQAVERKKNENKVG